VATLYQDIGESNSRGAPREFDSRVQEAYETLKVRPGMSQVSMHHNVPMHFNAPMHLSVPMHLRCAYDKPNSRSSNGEYLDARGAELP